MNCGEDICEACQYVRERENLVPKKGIEMKRSLLVAAAAAVGMALSAGVTVPAQAQTASVNVGVVTDYVFRGVSQTNEGAAVQGGFDTNIGPGYFGVWASTVDFGGTAAAGTDTEVDIYGGFKPSIMGWTFDLGAIAYRYVGAPDTANLGYYELKAATSVPLGPVSLGAAVFWSPNFTGPGSNEATYYEVNVAMPFMKTFTASGAYGHQGISGSNQDYNTWNAGITWMPVSWLALDGRYWDTSEHGLGNNYDARWVAGAKLIFTF